MKTEYAVYCEDLPDYSHGGSRYHTIPKYVTSFSTEEEAKDCARKYSNGWVLYYVVPKVKKD